MLAVDFDVDPLDAADHIVLQRRDQLPFPALAIHFQKIDLPFFRENLAQTTIRALQPDRLIGLLVCCGVEFSVCQISISLLIREPVVRKDDVGVGGNVSARGGYHSR